MNRTALATLVAVLVAGCDQPAPKPRPAPTSDNPGFDNSAAGQSIMQPKVIAETAPSPTPTPAPPVPTGATVLFARGSALDDVGRAAIDQLLAAPNLPTDAAWVLRGHSDSPGSDQANLATSRHRAEAVRRYLEEKGVAADRISVIALGERRPVAPNATLDGSDDPAGRARNRRVQIELVPPPPTPTPTDTPTAPPTPA